MNRTQRQLLYANHGETPKEAKLAKARLRKKLLDKMCYWAENAFDLENETNDIQIVGPKPKAFAPSIFEKREFRDIIDRNLDRIYEENRTEQTSPNIIALNLLGRSYWL